MGEDYVIARREENRCHIVLSRAAKRNALTLEMVEAVAAAAVAAEEDPAVRVIIVEAEGPIFSAGIDLMALAGLRAAAGDMNPARWLRRIAERMQRALNQVEAVELPVIGALHGKVIGLGLELALAFDLRVGTEDLLLSIPETRLGLVADVGGTTRLSRVVGPARAKDMLMTAREVDAQEALSWGLLNRVTPSNQLGEAAIALADAVTANAPLAVGLAKRIIDAGDGLDKHTQMLLERWAQSQLFTTEDVSEAMAAFLEKRPPEFRGT